MFWYHWPSWATELTGGAALFGVSDVWTGGKWPAALLVAGITSATYEAAWDPNGWSTKDVAQRAVGIVVGLAIARLLRR